VRSDATQAKTRIKHYYARRLLERGFWINLLRGRVRIGDALTGVVRSARVAQRAPAAVPRPRFRTGWRAECRPSPGRFFC
jgi:hypothetical protein